MTINQNTTATITQNTTATGFPIHTKQTAPETSREILEGMEQKLGFVPNLIKIMAESPALAHSYLGLWDIAITQGELSPEELNFVALVISEHQKCKYCIAAHSNVADTVAPIENEIVAAIREGSCVDNPRFEALRSFAIKLYDCQGYAPEAEVKEFIAKGFTRREVLDIVVIIAWKTLSGFTTALTATDLDNEFEPYA